MSSFIMIKAKANHNFYNIFWTDVQIYLSKRAVNLKQNLEEGTLKTQEKKKRSWGNSACLNKYGNVV